MTTVEAELLLNSIKGMGDSFARKNAFDQEMALRTREADARDKERLANEDYRKSAKDEMRRYHDEMATKAQGHNDLLEKQIGLKQAAAQMVAAQKDMQDSMQTFRQLAKTGKAPQETLLKYFQESMDTLPPQIHDQLLANPKYKAIYDGEVKFADLPDPTEANFVKAPNGGVVAIDPKTGHPVNVTPPHQDKPATERITEETVIPKEDAKPAVPGAKASWLNRVTGGMLGEPATPDQPAVPGSPERKIRRSYAAPAQSPLVAPPSPANILASQTPTMTTQGMPSAPSNPITANLKPLDAQTAAALLKEAGGDKTKARGLAKERGYAF